MSVTGFCYMAAVAEKHLRGVSQELGSWPQFEELAYMPRDVFEKDEILMGLRVEFLRGRAHMYRPGLAARLGVSVFPLVSLLEVVADGAPEGSLARSFRAQGSSYDEVPVLGAWVDAVRGVRIGGLEPPVFPGKEKSADVLKAYYEAYGLYCKLYGQVESGSVVSEAAPVVQGPPRGPNYLRNQQARMKKKVRREEARAAGGSFFARCDDATRDELVTTRANLLVLENKRRIVEESRKIDRLNSPVAAVEEAMRVVRLAESCRKNQGPVAGWAATVASDYSESVVRSVPGSVMSFESVGSSGLGAVASVSQTGADSTPPTRKSSSSRSGGAPVRSYEAEVRALAGHDMTAAEARRWLARYAHHAHRFVSGRTVAEVIGDSSLSASEVRKYVLLSRKVGNVIDLKQL